MNRIINAWCAAILVFTFFPVFPGCAKKTIAPSAQKQPATDDISAREVVAAVVNGVPITVDSLIKVMNRIAQTSSKEQLSDEEIKKRALDKLIFQELAYQKAQSTGIKPDEQFVHEAIQNLITNLGGEKEYQEYLKQQNVTEASLRAEIIRTLTIELMFAREVTAKVTVPEELVKQEYEREKGRFIAGEKTVVTDVAFLDSATQQQARNILKKIRADKNKDPWMLTLDGTFIVRTYAIDRNREMDRELYAAARKLKVNELSGVIKTKHGLHIMKLKEYSPERQLSFDETKKSLESKFLVQAQQKRLEEWQRELRQNQNIEIREFKTDFPEKSTGEASEKKN